MSKKQARDFAELIAWRLATGDGIRWCALVVLRLVGWDYQLIEKELVLTVLVDVHHVVVGAAPHLCSLAIGPIDYPVVHLFQFSIFLLGTCCALEDGLVSTGLVLGSVFEVLPAPETSNWTLWPACKDVRADFVLCLVGFVLLAAGFTAPV